MVSPADSTLKIRKRNRGRNRNRTMRIAPTFVALALLFAVITASAQAPMVGSVMSLTAIPVNVSQAGPSVTINILKWSTDAERDILVAASVPPPKPPAPVVTASPTAAAGATPAPVPFNPVRSLAAALDAAPTIGILWTNENSGYPIRYAYRAALPDGSERIILATNRRIASLSVTPEGARGPDFTIIEMKLNSKGMGEAKASLNTKIVVDVEDKTVALGNYSGAPVVLKNVNKRSAQ